MNKPAKRQAVLLILMGIVGLLVVRQYLPSLQLPTDGLLQERLRELKSLQGDLGVARKQYGERMEYVQQLKTLCEPYWITAPNGRLDQEINAEFSRLTRLAQLSATQRVDIARDRTSSSLQEVTVTLEFKGISMRELAGFFRQVNTGRNAGKLRWDYARIAPDNPRTPRGVNCTLRFKVFALNEEARVFIDSVTAPQTDGVKAGETAGVKRTARRNAVSGNTRK